MTQVFSEQLAGSCDMLAAVLVHSLWQGLLISVAVLLVLRTVPARCTNLRYAASVGGLAAVLLAALVTWTVLRLPTDPLGQPPETVAAAPPIGADSGYDAERLTETNERVESTTGVVVVPVLSDTDGNRAATERRGTWLDRLQQYAPAIVSLWVIGVAVMLLRTTSAVVRPQRWLAQEAAIDRFDLSRLESLAAELSIRLRLRRAVKLAVCNRVAVPSVLGVLWPTILVPPAMVTGIPIEQWRIILAHELAHVRRYDNLVNLLQMLIESLFFFNPAVWWISRQVRVEREASCDALAAMVAGKPVSVARTLIDVARSLKDGGVPVVPTLTALAEPADSGSLTDRVRRLLQPERASRPKLTGAGLAVALVVVMATGALVQQGTALAVHAAAELMSPKERIDTLARIQAESRGIVVAPGSSAEIANKPTETPAAGATREFVLHLRGITPDAPIRGNVHISGLHLPSGDDPDEFDLGELPLIDNELHVPVPVPCYLQVTPRDVVGYTFEEERNWRVKAGEGPETLWLSAKPAGAVHGRVFRSDGSPAIGALVFVLCLKETADGTEFRDRLNISSPLGAKFFRSLPLGGRYQAVARESSESGLQWVVSEPFTVDERHPVEQFDLHLPEGEPLGIQVLDASGRPMPRLPIDLSWGFAGPYYSSTFPVKLETDRDGFVRLENAVIHGNAGALKHHVLVQIAPVSGHAGCQCRLAELSSPSGTDYTIRLKQGVSASGVVVDADTWQPIPGAEVRIVAKDRNEGYGRYMHTTTDEHGEFRFDTLEPIVYEGTVRETSPRGTAVRPAPDSGEKVRYLGRINEHVLEGGSPDRVEWQVTIRRGSDLKPLPAE